MFTFETARMLEETGEWRRAIRDFISREHQANPHADAWLGEFSEEFSQKLGAAGYIGMTWPKDYGGHGRSDLERYVVLEELLAAGAPVSAHWVADRQMGPLILRYGSEEQKRRFLPAMAEGKCYWAIGMSEPNSGSDLASVRSQLVPDGSGWRLSGQKIWTSGAHRSHYMMTLVRTGEPGPDRHQGLTNVIVDLHEETVEIRPIRLMNGEHHFNEVFFHDTYIPQEMVLGAVGDGWSQVTEELAYERSGPERFLSTFPLLRTLLDYAQKHDPAALVIEVMPLVAELAVIRELSLSVAALLQKGANPVIEAALVKDTGTRFERKVTEIAERILTEAPSPEGRTLFSRLTAEALLHGPGFTIRGGTNEILRGIIARGLGVR